MSFAHDHTRRQFLKTASAIAGAAGFSLSPMSSAFGQSFPSRNINIYVPTREGGGADALLRASSGVWKKYLDNAKFEATFYPGAAGRVGYEKYMGLAKPDCYDLVFGNMGPESLNWVVQPPTFSQDDFFYFAQVDEDPGTIFVSRDSPLQTIDDIVAEGKKRVLNVGVSRLAHPATLGMLALGRHTGAQFNPIPLSGGKNTRAGVVTKEMDFGALPSGSIVSRAKNFKVVLMFTHDNPIPDRSDNAPTINAKFGMNLPSLYAGNRAYGIKKEAVENHPDRYKILTDTLQKIYGDPDFKAAIEKIKVPWEFIKYGNAEACAVYVKGIMDVGKDFKELLTGKS
ncbi:MAG: twin-arginine translocation signal domain-containing protein [Alphaproteobacteria bacterium]|nr:MAG: twin-arginine translocation signal domain-containing protein [Alphaproteobacteria bacterium]